MSSSPFSPLQKEAKLEKLAKEHIVDFLSVEEGEVTNEANFEDNLGVTANDVTALLVHACHNFYLDILAKDIVSIADDIDTVQEYIEFIQERAD